MSTGEHWLALMIGNTHEHWAEFMGHRFIQSWHQTHQTQIEPSKLIETDRNYLTQTNSQTHLETGPELWLASVVPAQTTRWLTYPNLHLLELVDIPLKNCYPTLGIDRALGAWGAGMIYGWPVLVIDGGTALTITAVDPNHRFMGGAILPGLGLMATSLTTRINTLPNIEFAAHSLPQCWGQDTPTAIESGIFWTVLAGLEHFIQDWQHRYPTSQIVLTGGDGPILKKGIEEQLSPEFSRSLILAPDLIVQAIALLRTDKLSQQNHPS